MSAIQDPHPSAGPPTVATVEFRCGNSTPIQIGQLLHTIVVGCYLLLRQMGGRTGEKGIAVFQNSSRAHPDSSGRAFSIYLHM